MGPRRAIGQIQGLMRKLRLDAFFVLNKINRQYLSGFTGSSGVLAVAKRGAELFVDDRYLIRARRESGVRVRKIAELHNPLSPPYLKGGTPSLRIREGGGELRIGIEDRITLREFAGLKKQLPGRKWKVTRNLVEDLRAVKSSAELAAIRKGAWIIDRIFWEIYKSFSPSRREGGDEEGVRTEADIVLLIGRLAKKFGADGLAFDPIVASGPNAAAPHHNPGRDKIKKNNFLLLDFGVKVGDYHSDFTRTLFLGRPRKWQEKIYNTVLDAQEAGIASIHNSSPPPLTLRGGVKKAPSLRVREGGGELRGKDVDKVVRESISSAGFGKYFTHSTGHGVGLEIHELPNR